MRSRKKIRPKRKTRKKLPKISSTRKKLDTVFNRYIRARDGKCIFCQSTELLQCSHYYGKQARPILRWDERNAYTMCARHHYLHHHGAEALYALWMFKKYGMKFMINLNNYSKIQIKYTRNEYRILLEYYTNKLNALG